MSDAGMSGRVRVLPAWRATASDEEARAFLQHRLSIYSGVLFAGLGLVDTFFWWLYSSYALVEQWRWIVGGAAIVLAALGLVWRLVIARRRLSERRLYRYDAAYAIAIGLSMGAAAVLSPERHAAGYAVLVHTIFAVFVRAFIVPSTGRRTAVTATLSFVPLVAAAAWLAANTTQDVPGPAYVIGALVLCSVAVLLATLGSRLIYELQRRVSDAVQLGQYVVEHKIGEGGIGTVYRGHHVMLRRPTAIKLLRADRVGAETLARFEREVQHTSQLAHPNTVAVFDYGRSSEGVFYYAMEYLDGLDLEQIVRTYGPLGAGRTIDILVQVCGALHEAHERGIVHRDIKPANIILCEHGGVPDVAKVVDFGLVKEITHDAVTTSENIVGTPAYVAPETITNPRATSPAADLYALGAVGYFLLSGRRLFDGNNAVELCIQHVTAEPQPLSRVALNVTPALERVIMRCLRKRAEERYASAAELADALRAIERADWSEDDAAAWWATRRAACEVGTTSSAPTHTITIDLEHRA
jgi:serine/threonine-protein kinase